MTSDKTSNNLQSRIDAVFSEVKDMMKRKNEDYGDSWKELRVSSITDRVLTKILKIRNLEDKCNLEDIIDIVSEEYIDVIGYCVLALVKLKLTKR